MTPDIDHLVAAGVKPSIAAAWIPFVQQALATFQIESPRQVAGWLAQTAHESGGYTMLIESLNYRAATMAVCWPHRFAEQEPDPKRPGKTRPKKDAKGANIPNKFALALERNEESLGNVVYSSRMGNGPPESGDGFLFRGRGLKQITGRDNYTRCGLAIGMDLANNPDLLLEPQAAALSAAWFWSVNKCGPIADSGDFVALTKKINGGTIGMPDREKRYRAVLAAMGAE